VNDKEFENVLAIAIANIQQPDSSKEFLEALAIKAPLTALIEAMLVRKPSMKNRANLEAIAALEQGRPDDLSAPVFRSYVLGKTGMTEESLDRCAREIETFRRILQAIAADEPVTMAARDEEGFGGGRIAAAEFLDIYDKSDE
jgi:hypothetical protein